MLRPGSLLNRGLALVVTLGATLGLYEFAVLPLITAHAGARATIDQATALLQRYHALGEQRARLADQVSENERFVADSGSYLAGRSDVLAAAALYERVGSVLERADGELRSTQVLPAQAAKTGVPLRLTALKIRFIIDIDEPTRQKVAAVLPSRCTVGQVDRQKGRVFVVPSAPTGVAVVSSRR